MYRLIGFLWVALLFGCSHLPTGSTPDHPQGTPSVLAGQQIADQLNVLYNRKVPNCNNSNSQPAFLCSGVTLRVTTKDPANVYKVWDPSPTAVAHKGVSFSYLRADDNFGKLAWGNANGLIFYPIFESPTDKIDVNYLCSYPMDAWGWYRTSACGHHASYPTLSNACQDAGITTAAQWKTAWDDSPSDHNRRQCFFDIRDERNALAGPAFYQSILAKGLLGTTGFNEQNEIVIEPWQAGSPNTLPLMAFFYVEGSAPQNLADARYNQQDFYNSTNPRITVPIIRLTLPNTAAGVANFSYNAADQVVGGAATIEHVDGVGTVALPVRPQSGLPLSKTPQPRHAQNVLQPTIAHRVVAQPPFGFKAELLVQSNGRFVVGKHGQFDPLQVHPVVGDVQRGGQQLRADALALPLAGDGHAETAGVAAANPGKLFQADVADHHALMQRHHLQPAFVILHQALAPHLAGLMGQLQGLSGHERIVVQRGNAVDVAFVETREGNGGVNGRHRGLFLEQ